MNGIESNLKPLARECKIQVDDLSPFENDKFQAQQNYNDLLSLIEKTETPFVYALTAPWGAGKTTFVEMSTAELRKSGYTAFIINVWANDHLLNTQEIFINHLTEIIRSLEVFADRKKKAKKFITANKNTILTIAGHILRLSLRNSEIEVTEYFKDLGINIKEIKESGFDLIQGTQDVLKGINSRATQFQKIRDELQTLIDKHIQLKKPEHRTKPVIIFIDELDRCMPSRVINFFDNLKHIFELKNVIFILSVDEEQLKHAVESVFGTRFSVNSYLERFINLNYNLNFKRHYSKYFQELIYQTVRKEEIYGNLKAQFYNQVEGFISKIDSYIVGFNLSLRDLHWVANFATEFVLRSPILWVYHMDYIIFVLMFKKKFPKEYREYFLDYFKGRELDGLIFRLRDKLTYFDDNYFKIVILPRYLLHRFVEIKLIEEFAKYNESGRYDYSEVIKDITIHGYSDGRVDRINLFAALEHYVRE